MGFKFNLEGEKKADPESPRDIWENRKWPLGKRSSICRGENSKVASRKYDWKW